jgi:hypothetical protein
LPKISTHNARMLKLFAWAIAEGKVNSDKEFCEKIKFHYTNLSNVRTGKQSFTIDHIINACLLTGANANWILGLEQNMMRKPSRKAIDMLKEAVIAVEMERG